MATDGVERRDGLLEKGRRFLHHELVARAVEAVLADAKFPAKLAGQSIGVGVLGNGPVERRVEHRHLRQVRILLAARVHQRHRRWIVQWRQVTNLFEPGHHPGIDHGGVSEISAAVDQAMAHRVGLEPGVLPEQRHHFREGRGVVGHRHLLGELLLADLVEDDRRFGSGRADPLGFAPRQFDRGRHGQEPVLERRAAAIEDQDVHGEKGCERRWRGAARNRSPGQAARWRRGQRLDLV